MRWIVGIAVLIAHNFNPLDAMLLQDRLHEAHAGDYIVAAQDKSYTLIHIVDEQQEILYLQELTVPQAIVKSGSGVWQQWLKEGAPGHTSWLSYAMERQTGDVKQIYDVDRQNWISMSEGDHLLGTLLQLDLTPIPDHLRKRVGASPLPGELDHRRLWHPPLYYGGKRMEQAELTPWKGYWPPDGSELAGKAVILYLPDTEYLSFFPYWIEVAGGIARAKLRIKDSGRGLHAPNHLLSTPDCDPIKGSTHS